MGTNCLSIETESISIELIKSRYPAYYRAWKSMLNHGKTEVSMFWRGTHGLMTFIEDTLELENSPSALPQYADYIKLKRIDESKKFIPGNVVWKISKVATKFILTKEHEAESEFSNLETQFAGLLKRTSQVSIQDKPVGIEVDEPENVLEQKYRRTEDKENRLEELFSKSMEGALSKSEELELEMLSKVVVEVQPVESELGQLVDGTTSAEVEDFYNKRWSDL